MNLLSKKTKDITFSNLDVDGNGAINSLPDDMLEEILIRIPAEFLCKNVTLVSKRWRNIIETDIFWIEKGLRDEKFDKRVIQILQEKNKLIPKQLYFNCIFNKNLLKNPCGDLGFKYWVELESDHENIENLFKDVNNSKKYIDIYKKNYLNEKFTLQSWYIECEQTGTAKNKQLLKKNKEPYKNFVTSFTLIAKLQVIDVGSFITEGFIEQYDVHLEVKEFYAARMDCGSRYILSVHLVDNDFNMVDNFYFQKRSLIETDGEWRIATHDFVIVKPFRYILFYHAGCDLKFWKGFYGSKMTNSSVRICIK